MKRAIGAAENPKFGKSDTLLRAIWLSSGALISLLCHGSVLATLLYLAEPKSGAIEQPTEAISLASVRSEVLEAVSASPLTAAAAETSVAASVGEVEESAAAQPDQAAELEVDQPLGDAALDEPEVRDAPEPEGIDVLRGDLQSDRSAGEDVQTLERNSEARARSRRNRDQSEPRESKKQASPRSNGAQPSEAKKNGAASVRAKVGSTSSAARVSASSGSALNYAALVRARVAARKPGGGGGHGTVVVTFRVARSGALNSARVTRSSGNSSLDGSVLAAVRSAGPFPPAPPGANLTFSMPFYFK